MLEVEWLQHKDQQQTNNVKFQQFWLWLIRTLIFLLIAFIVTKPFITINEKINKRHLLLVKEDISTEILSNVLDTIETNNWNIKWLNWDLEEIDLNVSNISNTKTIHPYEAIELLEYKNINPISVTVLGNYNEAELKAQPISKSLPINWILLPFKNDNLQEELAVKKTSSSNEVLYVEQKEYLSKVITASNNSEKLSVIDFVLDSIVIAYSESEKQTAKVIYSALKALAAYHQIEINLAKQKVNSLDQKLSADVLFWLSDEDLLNSNLYNKIFYYDKSLIKNTFTKNDINDAINFNIEINGLGIPDFLNELLFKNIEVDRKYNELLSLPINNTFSNISNNEQQVSGFVDVNKKIDFVQFLVSILLSLILVERLLYYLINK